MALLRVLLLASLPCLGLTQEERLLIVYPAAPHPQNTLLPQSNEIDDSYTKVSSIKEATKKPVMRTKSTSSVSTTYSVSSSVSSSESSRRIDIGEGKERVVMGRVGKVNRERMRDFYSRRRGDARKLLIIPPTRLMLTRGGLPEKAAKVDRRENEVEEELSAASSFRSGLQADVASRRSWEVRREEASRREERNVRKGVSAPNSLVSAGGSLSSNKVEDEEEERRLPKKADVKIGHLRPAASRRLSVSRQKSPAVSSKVSRNIFPEVRQVKPAHQVRQVKSAAQQVTTVKPTVSTTSGPTVHSSEVGRIVILERPEVAGGSVWGAPTTSGGGDLGMDEQRSRLRRILAPKPRHHRGPVPTLTTPEEEKVEEKEVVAFVCPHLVGSRKKLWRAHPDPTSCRHYFICMALGDQTSPAPAPVRHGCRYGLVFSPETETCVPGARCSKAENNRVPARTTSTRGTTRRPKQAAPGKKQGLFVEFVEFLIRSRLFNEKVVKSLLDNKELFQ